MTRTSICFAALAFLPSCVYADATFVDLGSAGSFAVLGATTVTNTGATELFGNLGVSPGTAITGFGPGVVEPGFTTDSNDALAMQAHSDLVTAYNFAAAESCGTNLTGMDLGGLILTPGCYSFSSSAALTGILTLNNLGDPNAVFLFQIGSTLTTASASSVVFTNGLDPNVFWQVGSSATLGTTTAFEGNILAKASITLNTGATIGCGSALAETAAVTLDTNTISVCSSDITSAPEPSSAALLLLGAPALLWLRRRRSLNVWPYKNAAR